MQDFQTNSQSTLSEKLRSIFWPIHKHELKKFIPMSLLMFLILFNQNILRILKESVVIPEIAVEVTSFAKVCCVTPMAAVFFLIYTKMVNKLTYDKIFTYLTLFFVGYFLLFAIIFYPHHEFFHINKIEANNLMLKYPYVKWFIAIAAYWSHILFYVLSELWPNIFYILLFWQFANEITTTQEAKRFYTLFSLFGNSSLIVVGLMMMNLASEKSFMKNIIAGEDKVVLVQVNIFIVSLISVLSAILVRYVTKNVLEDPSLYIKAKKERDTHEKMGILDSIKYISSSKYLWLMLICSAAFGLSMNLVEAVWKDRMKEFYPTVNSYAEFNAFFILWTGIAIMVMTIIGNNLMRSYGWFVVAIISPILILVTGTIFFVMIVFDEKVINYFDVAIIMSPLAMAIAIGTIQNILSKGMKYSIWDTSTEMLYIPLDDELKTKGKAAVSLVSSKVGKASSGLIQMIIFTIFPAATLVSISPILMVVFIAVCFAWIFAVGKIFTLYKKIVGQV